MTPDTARETLLARRSEILARLAGIDDRLDEPEDKDREEAATQTEDDQMLLSLGELERAEVARIDAALDRVTQGTWGVCVRCGDAIEPKRLELLPETPFCVSCAG